MIPLQPIFEALLADCAHVHVNLNPQYPGVVVPEQHAKGKTMIVTLGLNLPVPIKDLVTDDAGIRGTLSFGGKPFHCTVPWDSIYAMEGEGSALVVLNRPMTVTEIKVEAKTKPRGGLRLV